MPFLRLAKIKICFKPYEERIKVIMPIMNMYGASFISKTPNGTPMVRASAERLVAIKKSIKCINSLLYEMFMIVYFFTKSFDFYMKISA